MKHLILGLLLSASSLSYAQKFAMPIPGGESGGGGDTDEARVNEIRSDILKWIERGGSPGLIFGNSMNLGLYNQLMTEILQPKAVVVTFVENDNSPEEELRVSVSNKPKTCRGFYSRLTAKPNILCNISRFRATSASLQYNLIHHEYAGLVGVERNTGAASDYEISNQLSEYLIPTTVLRLGLRRGGSELGQDESAKIIEAIKVSLTNNILTCRYTIQGENLTLGKWDSQTNYFNFRILEKKPVTLHDGAQPLLTMNFEKDGLAYDYKFTTNKALTVIEKVEAKINTVKKVRVNNGTIAVPYFEDVSRYTPYDDFVCEKIKPTEYRYSENGPLTATGSYMTKLDGMFEAGTKPVLSKIANKFYSGRCFTNYEPDKIYSSALYFKENADFFTTTNSSNPQFYDAFDWKKTFEYSELLEFRKVKTYTNSIEYVESESNSSGKYEWTTEYKVYGSYIIERMIGSKGSAGAKKLCYYFIPSNSKK
jgi:hypothetical protein